MNGSACFGKGSDFDRNLLYEHYFFKKGIDRIFGNLYHPCIIS